MEKGYVTGFITLGSRFESLFRYMRDKKKEKMRKEEKRGGSLVYVREHYNKEVRQGVMGEVKKESMEILHQERKRKQERIWTLNRSPHGNKTAREQFGRQVWQRTREIGWPQEGKKDPLARRKERIQDRGEYVSRKEKKQVRV